MESLQLRSGATIPSVGLGLWKIPNSEVAGVVQEAIRSGYRHIDSACDYGNEASVGEGLQGIFQSGVICRDDLWVTSKLWNTYHRPEHVGQAARKSLTDLRLDYLDLYLIHFPISLQYVPFEERYPPGWLFDPSAAQPRMVPDAVPIIETWQAMEELVGQGLVREIGVSNFGVSLLRDLQASARIAPSVLQVEMHPYLTQDKLLRYCRESGVAVTAFSPLGAQSYYELNMATPSDSALTSEVVLDVSRRHSRTPAQIVLRWGIQRGTAVVPKTSKLSRLKENLSLWDFELSAEEMTSISDLNRHHRFNDPGKFCEEAFNTFFPIYE